MTSNFHVIFYTVAFEQVQNKNRCEENDGSKIYHLNNVSSDSLSPKNTQRQHELGKRTHFISFFIDRRR